MSTAQIFHNTPLMNIEKKYYDFIIGLTNDAVLSIKLANELEESATSPALFFARHSEILEADDVRHDYKHLTLRYLIEVLKKETYVVELGTQPNLEALNQALIRLSNGKITKSVLTARDKMNPRNMLDLLETADDCIMEGGLTILYLPSERTTFPIAVVSTEAWDRLDALLDELFDPIP